MKTTFQKIIDARPRMPEKRLNDFLNKFKPSSFDEELTIKEMFTDCSIYEILHAFDSTDDEKIKLLFCADVAESVLPIFEKHSKDESVKNCIKSTKDYARGKISWDVLEEARSNAWNAAGSDIDSAMFESAAAAADETVLLVASAAVGASAFDNPNTSKEKEWYKIKQMLQKYI